MLQLISPVIVCLCSMAAVASGLYYFRSAWAALLLYHVVLIIALVLRKNPPFDHTPLWRGFSMITVAVGTAMMTFITFYLFQKLYALDPTGAYIARRFARVGLNTRTFIPFAAYCSFINPLLEETYWRGNYASNRPSAYMNDPLFGLFHLPIYVRFASPAVILGSIAGITCMGLCARWLAKRLNGLVTPTIIHLVGDLTAMAAMGALIYR